MTEPKNTSYWIDTGPEFGGAAGYDFLGEKVYVFDPGTCGADMTSEVIDEDCNSLGFLGGIAGNVEINGANFSEAIARKIIWKR
mgnify:CR=1 FL=1